MEDCRGTHHYFVAETGTVEQEGKVVCVIICTACGESKLIEYKVAGDIKLLGGPFEKGSLDSKHR